MYLRVLIKPSIISLWHLPISPAAYASPLDQHCSALPPPAGSTYEAGADMAYMQVAQAHYTGTRADGYNLEEDTRGA